MRVTAIIKLAIAVVGSGSAACEKTSSALERRPAGRPVETSPANAPDQKPAFAGQTRAPHTTSEVAFEARRIARRLDHPWSVAFLPDGAFLVTERPGRLLVISRDGGERLEVAGVPEVDARGQGGLFDIALDPSFASNRTVFFTFAEPRDGGNGTALARAELVRDGTPRLDDLRVIWRMTPTIDSDKHFGGRIVFDRKGALFVTTGERSILEGRAQAQRLNSALGKVIRVDREGRAPLDNPFIHQPALSEIWSYGHRNVQAAALHPRTGRLWIVDHGARGGDEINIVERGKDFGWPTITYGVEYSGEKIGKGLTQYPGMVQPIYYWDPVIAPSGMAFYTGDLFPAWRGSLLVGSLEGKHVARLTLEGERVIGEERLLPGRARIRDVRQGPDGAVYVLTDEDDGELLRLSPSSPVRVGLTSGDTPGGPASPR